MLPLFFSNGCESKMNDEIDIESPRDFFNNFSILQNSTFSMAYLYLAQPRIAVLATAKPLIQQGYRLSEKRHSGGRMADMKKNALLQPAAKHQPCFA